MSEDLTSLEKGAQLIKDYVQTLPSTPGFYRMLGQKNDVLYIGDLVHSRGSFYT